jgi:glycerol-3-phosphate acyltransferase PlsX
MGTIRYEIQQSIRARVGGWMLKRRLKSIFKGFDYVQYGGAPLLGCRGVSIICHGKSNEEAISNAVLLASRAVQERLGERISAEIEREGIADSAGGQPTPIHDPAEPPAGVYGEGEESI